jgi:outer membrane protein assembly factor BamE (lipoprotein component of BamABCDE complex)
MSSAGAQVNTAYEEIQMKKLLAAVVASAFAFGAASTFAFDAPNHRPAVQGHVVQVQKVKMHKVKHAKKHHRHHAKRAA